MTTASLVRCILLGDLSVPLCYVGLEWVANEEDGLVKDRSSGISALSTSPLQRGVMSLDSQQAATSQTFSTEPSFSQTPVTVD